MNMIVCTPTHLGSIFTYCVTNKLFFLPENYWYLESHPKNEIHKNKINSAKNVGGTSSELRTYKFYDIFPTEVSAIELSYDNSDQIEDFTVTFQVQYFTVGNSTQANRGAAGQTLIQ